MPPKRKDFLKPKGKPKTKAQDPQSENDFLEAADEFEQAAGKWRAGDAAKATRFFNRAIDMYNEGLKKYPRSFDLAYNKANLEYNITEDERIMSHLGSKTALLEETLNSHRFAITLDPSNTDAQFNTAQVLTSLAEALLEAGTQETAKVPARTLLEEAVDIFTKCLDKQQSDYEQMQAEFAKAQAEAEYLQSQAEEHGHISEATRQDQDDMETSSNTSEAPGDWATVEEPLTPETILETCIAQLGALTTLIGLYDPLNMAAVEVRAKYGLDTANTKIPALLGRISGSPFPKSEEPKSGPTLSISSASTAEEEETSPKDDALLAIANFQFSVTEIEYRSGRTDAKQYADTIQSIFSSLNVPTTNAVPSLASANALSAYADALIDFASAISDSLQYAPESPTLQTDLELQWTALTQAQTVLTQLSTGTYASTLSASRLAGIFSGRGDADLFRFRITLFEAAKPAWVNSRAVLVANAGVFYRGARTYAEKAGTAETRGVADAKAIVAEVLKEVSSGSREKKSHWKGRSADVGVVLEQMVEEGVVGRENVDGVMGLLA